MRQQHTRAANFTPIDKLKEKATAAAMKKQYSVFDYYKDQTYRPGIASARVDGRKKSWGWSTSCTAWVAVCCSCLRKDSRMLCWLLPR